MPSNAKIRPGFVVVVVGFILILVSATILSLPSTNPSPLPESLMRMKAISTALFQYYTDNGSFPPGYGYWKGNDSSGSPGYERQSYTAMLGIEGAPKLLDRFSTGYDTDGDGKLS